LARYIATSASRRSTSIVAGSSRSGWWLTAMPIEAWTKISTPSTTNASSSCAARRSATIRAPASPAVGSRTANSSPPRRAMTSVGRRIERRRGPTCARSWSPNE
jgi:hypothetical protein